MTVDGQMVASIMNTIGINFDWGTGGTLILGGKNNTNGLLEIHDASDKRVGRWDNTKLYLGNIESDLTNPNTSIDTNGAIETKSLKADDYVYVNGNTRSYFNIPMGNTSCFTRVSNAGFMVRDNYGNDIYVAISDYNNQGLRIRPTNYSYGQAGVRLDGNGLSIYGDSIDDFSLTMLQK